MPEEQEVLFYLQLKFTAVNLVQHLVYMYVQVYSVSYPFNYIIYLFCCYCLILNTETWVGKIVDTNKIEVRF